jgi:hypothetical protein
VELLCRRALCSPKSARDTGYPTKCLPETLDPRGPKGK